MKSLSLAGAGALALLLAGCGDRSNVGPDDHTSGNGTGTAQAEAAYSAAGTVTAITGDQVTISHGPVQGLGWPAMTMTFRAGAPELIQGIAAGDRIAFEFTRSDGGYTLTSVIKAP